ncbi:succinylglutamate desuccinylase/aspartoacylase family protein [Oceanibacterium hippocampi]|uniref:Succinylglutamate desuccinylase / Aspartoacylase family protein n=1 Tax=Oceanibacterium hippocampi TaxID=745714 RepID=A0A1Y5TNV2_9PROT|nr:succinylglutamate desuccinylase/aspartoacylase family protein [Oceanibacterium hippocampi]SLN64780.1 Succinylglutamate desuccinylase / Aspartoacylase family protein [Oceanibacterium hippocampi]
MKTISVGTAKSTGPGIVKGTLRVGSHPDGDPVEIPVIIARGETDGPVLWMHGCVHGDEYCGTFIIHELMRSLDPKKIKGTVVALPILNLTAFLKNQRMSPYEAFGGGDLNRCFPGKVDGSVTEQMAYAIYTPLKEYADYLIDFHTAFTPDTRWQLFSKRDGKVGEMAEKMARAFGFDSTLPAPADILQGAAMQVAANDGIPCLIVESGGMGAGFDRATLEDGAERLRNVMRALGLMDGAVTDYGPLTYFSNFAWVSTTGGGLYEPLVKCGDRIEKGQVLGTYFNTFGEKIGEAKATHGGVALAIHPGPTMPQGATLIHIGLDPRKV